MIAKIVKVNIKSVDSDGVALGSIVLEDNTSYPIYGEEAALKQYEGLTATTRVVSFISVASLGAAIAETTNNSGFNVLVNSANRGSSYLNFDPRSITNTYTDATFLILDAVDKNEDWTDLTCIGCTTKFTLRWFHHGVKKETKSYVGKIAMTDINKNSYGFNTSKEVIVLDVQLFNNDDINRAKVYINSVVNSYPALKEYMDKIKYFGLLENKETGHMIVKTALMIDYAIKLSNHYTGANLNNIISALVIRSLKVLVKQIDVNPDLALYAKLYVPNWTGSNITMYILGDANVYKNDLDRYIITLAEEFVNKIYAGGTIECAS